MSRKLLTLGLLAAAFMLVVATSDAEAKRCRNHYRSNDCCQSQKVRHDRQRHDCGYQRTSYVAANTCCAPRPTCCAPRLSCAAPVVRASCSTPQVYVEQVPQAPAPESPPVPRD